jgi:hypothetical protein
VDAAAADAVVVMAGPAISSNRLHAPSNPRAQATLSANGLTQGRGAKGNRSDAVGIEKESG